MLNQNQAQPSRELTAVEAELAAAQRKQNDAQQRVTALKARSKALRDLGAANEILSRPRAASSPPAQTAAPSSIAASRHGPSSTPPANATLAVPSAELRERISALLFAEASYGRERMALHLVQTITPIAEALAILSAAPRDQTSGPAIDFVDFYAKRRKGGADRGAAPADPPAGSGVLDADAIYAARRAARRPSTDA